MTRTGCISEDVLLDYVERRLAPEGIAAVESHCRACHACRNVLAEVARATAASSGAPAERGPPEDHYEVLGPIGAGGMGVVYAARDRRLGRTVALKMVHPGGPGVDAGKLRERLLREARAMARLSHPNVLAVYGVGEMEGQVFIAMELVDGGTLAAWLRERRRGWREVVDVFLPAAKGLAAAHAAGLIHRDFKPENVLVGTDGRVRVTDFGLARALAPVAEVPRDGDAARAADALGATALAGSPAYMAPEQLRGEPIDARADVFSFCVALYEGLYGQRPFRGESVAELEAAITRGAVHRPRGGDGAPAWLRRTLLRGLRPSPDARHPGMEPLIGALEHGRRRARWRAASAAVLLAAIALAATLTLWRERLTASRGAAGIRSLAVLPLEDLSVGAHPSSLADAFTEALTTDLGRTHGLRVTGRHSASAVQAKGTSVADVGRALKVDALVEGSIRQVGDRIRIDLRVVRTGSGAQVWAARFEGPAQERFVLEDEACRSVRAALALGGDARSRAPPTSSPEAFDLYIRGKIHLRRENPEDDAEAIRLLEQAVAIAPDFAAAHAALARAYGLRVAQFAPGDRSALERAQVAIEKALRLDPELAEAHYEMAHLLWGILTDRFLHERAIQEAQRAAALNPNLAEVHHLLGNVYMHIGLLDRAMEETQKAVLLDPADDNAIRRIALVLARGGAYEEALRTFRQVPQQANPSLWNHDVAWTLQHLGRAEEARAVIGEYLKAHPEDRGGVVTSTRAILFAQAGDRRSAEADIHAAIEKGKGYVHFHHAEYNIASAYALLGDGPEAARWLRAAAETGFPCYPLFERDPNLARIRQDAGYVALMAELKPQWERYRASL